MEITRDDLRQLERDLLRDFEDKLRVHQDMMLHEQKVHEDRRLQELKREIVQAKDEILRAFDNFISRLR
jgi:hypothetical protein